MTVLFREGPASVAEIAEGMPDPPSDTALRTLLRILEDKGHVQRSRDGRRNLYRPVMSRKRAGRAALLDVIATFFGGSLRDAVATHLADPEADVEAEELDRLRKLIADARREK